MYFDYDPITLERTATYFGSNETATKSNTPYIKYFSSIIPVEITKERLTGKIKIITFVGGDAYSAPIMHVKRTGSEPLNTFFYLHRDYLGSILAITDQNAHLVERRQFGAWGTIDKFWNSTGATEFNFSTTLLDRGYTGHEHLFFVSLINMNGRLYDAKLGRFLSPDNFVQDPFSTQSFNRYGYVVNNPLSFTDESGECFLVAALIGAAISVITNGISNAVHNQPFFKGAGMAALTGFIGGAVSFGIGNVVTQMAKQGVSVLGQVAFQTMAHSYLGGMMSAMSGGDIGAGMLSGAIGSLSGFGAGKLLKNASNFWQGAGIIGSGAIMGGVSSRMAGGNFWDGFRNGAISAGLNHAVHSGAFGEGLAIATITGKLRHIIRPDAYFVGGTASAGGVVGTEISGGGMMVWTKDGYVFQPYVDFGEGISTPDAAAGLAGTKFYHSGTVDQILATDFYGIRWNGNLSVGYGGVSGGLSLSYSNVKNSNNFIIGIGGYLGVGIPGVSLSGTYGAAGSSLKEVRYIIQKSLNGK